MRYWRSRSPPCWQETKPRPPAGSVAWYAHLGEQVGYAWRFELRQRELWSRIDPDQAESLLVLARQRRSAKYEALALSALGRRDEALAVARPTGSDWLVARIGPVELGHPAVVRMSERLPEDLRSRFLTLGPLPAAIGN